MCVRKRLEKPLKGARRNPLESGGKEEKDLSCSEVNKQTLKRGKKTFNVSVAFDAVFC